MESCCAEDDAAMEKDSGFSWITGMVVDGEPLKSKEMAVIEAA